MTELTCAICHQPFECEPDGDEIPLYCPDCMWKQIKRGYMRLLEKVGA